MHAASSLCYTMLLNSPFENRSSEPNGARCRRVSCISSVPSSRKKKLAIRQPPKGLGVEIPRFSSVSPLVVAMPAPSL